MRLQCRTLYSFLAMLLTVCSQASPNNISLSEPSLDANSFEDLYRCFDTKATMRLRTRSNDCARAAAQLPNLYAVNSFHRGGDPEQDPYALPKIRIFNTCQIKIDLRFGRPDESSWSVINQATIKIMAACLFGYGQSANTGGEIRAEDFIIITVEKAQARVLGAEANRNDTVVATERRRAMEGNFSPS